MVICMLVIRNNLEAKIEIKGSKFIAKVYRIHSVGEVSSILEELKKEYKEATHICYAYIVHGDRKCSDDSEPSGTAGLPILQVLERRDLNYVLAVVVRYFGGVKLGASNLTRAYANIVRDALNEAVFATLTLGYLIEIEVPYDKTQRLDYLLRDVDNVVKEYQEEVRYQFSIPKEDFSSFSCYQPKILKEVYIEKNQSK